MNPYQHLFDDPDDLEAREHTSECRSGGGIPWHSVNPIATMRAAETGSTLRDRLTDGGAGHE